jgi:site-specific DNA-methyltransferase (adenine-specific)
MTPYYQHGGITIYHGDCREVSVERADAIVTDPPYGETSLQGDRQVRGWMHAAEGIASSLWCFGSLEFFMEIARTGESSRWTRAQERVWEMHNGSGFHADRFKRVHELIVHFYRGQWSGIYHPLVFTRYAVARAVRRKIRPFTWEISAQALLFRSTVGRA